MSVKAPPFSLKIPVHHRDVFYPLLDDESWAEEFARIRLPYETRVLAEGQIGPRTWVRLNSYTIGEGGSGGSVWIELASRRPSPAEIVAGRGLLRAFASDSSERRRILSQTLLHIILLEYAEESQRPLWHAPSNAVGVQGALVGAETIASPVLWSALKGDLNQNRPSTVVALRDAGGVGGLEGFDGFTTAAVEVPAGVRLKILTEVENHWSRFGRISTPGSGLKWVQRRLGPHRDLDTASTISNLMRFGEYRRRYRSIPRKLEDGELSAYYPRNAVEAAACASASLIPIAPGVFWDVTGGSAGDAQTTAGYSHRNHGAISYTAIATSMRQEQRANFLLAALSAVIVASASSTAA
ncbi:MAG: hypothetical protein OXG46_09520 [Chloroflexi bacterium]|nr:hypothetical protein [Chloroflexota bacterium]MCY3939425.1 hypothetical protein [Chloroflexota bacterium]